MELKEKARREKLLKSETISVNRTLQPESVEPDIQLIAVEMAAGNQPAMIEAFCRLVKRQPENPAGFKKIVWGLLPRWRGSHERIRQLAIAPRWTATVTFRRSASTASAKLPGITPT